MSGTKSMVRAVLGGLVLAAMIAIGGCGDGGHHHHMNYGGEYYPSYSRSDGHDGGYHDGGALADRDDGWRHR